MEKKLNYNTIDVVKLVMAICVVAIHTHPFENMPNMSFLGYYNSFIECAVPFFFLASGFLLASRFDGINDLIIIKKHIIKLVKLYLKWMIIYTPLELCYANRNRIPMLKEILLYLRGVLLLGQQYNSWPLWYLLSSIYALLLIYILIKRKSKKIILFSAFFIMFLSFSFDFIVTKNNYNGLLSTLSEIIIRTIANGRILQGFFYIVFGAALVNCRGGILIYSFLFIIGLIGNRNFDGIIGSLFLVVSSIGLFKTVSLIRLKDSQIYLKLRKLSTDIYLIHMYVWSFYYYFVYGRKTYGMDSFIFVTVFSVLISYLWYSVKNSKVI